VEKFDENDFLLIKSNYDSSGNKIFELYQNKNDSDRFFTKNFWENGSVQASMFYYKNEKNGPMKMFDTSGALDFEGIYIRDQHTGLDIYYRRGKIVDFSFFLNGKEMPIDSLQKELLFK
jgi:antitoxin component YwqK of YwqJK toxin-antitoxin module